MKQILLLLALSALAPVAFANDAASSPSADREPTADTRRGDDKVCERRKKLGSNQVERVCMTRDQQTAAREKAQADLHRLGRCSGNEGPCVGTF